MKGKNFQIFGRSSGVLFPDDGTLQEEHVWEGWNEEFSNGCLVLFKVDMASQQLDSSRESQSWR